MSKYWHRLIVALDLDDKAKIKRVVRSLSSRGVKFKIGSIAFTKFGPSLVKGLINQGADVFLDLKLYDIPNTMKKTAAVIAQMHCWAFTVHIKAGEQALLEVKKEVASVARSRSLRKPLILGVTELTSEIISWSKVEKLVSIASNVGLDGVIASAWEAAQIKRLCARGKRLKVIIPGIRNLSDNNADQRRVATAKFAFSQGADFIVVGRPIVTKKDSFLAAQDILK